MRSVRHFENRSRSKKKNKKGLVENGMYRHRYYYRTARCSAHWFRCRNIIKQKIIIITMILMGGRGGGKWFKKPYTVGVHRQAVASVTKVIRIRDLRPDRVLWPRVSYDKSTWKFPFA